MHTFDRAINATGTGLTELGVKFSEDTANTSAGSATIYSEITEITSARVKQFFFDSIRFDGGIMNKPPSEKYHWKCPLSGHVILTNYLFSRPTV